MRTGLLEATTSIPNHCKRVDRARAHQLARDDADAPLQHTVSDFFSPRLVYVFEQRPIESDQRVDGLDPVHRFGGHSVA